MDDNDAPKPEGRGSGRPTEKRGFASDVASQYVGGLGVAATTAAVIAGRKKLYGMKADKAAKAEDEAAPSLSPDDLLPDANE